MPRAQWVKWFHVKQSDILDYAQAISEWDAKHRIVGKTDPRILIEQSIEALNNAGLKAPLCVVDIGAGSGLVGIPWLYANENNKAIFVEPDKKKCAFLHYYLSARLRLAGRYMVLSQIIQSVSRETVDTFSSGQCVFLSRAFSGDETLEDSLAASSLRGEKFYVFSSGPSGHSFVEWSK